MSAQQLQGGNGEAQLPVERILSLAEAGESAWHIARELGLDTDVVREVMGGTGPQLTVQEVVITPAIAADYLASTRSNRNISQGVVRRYAREMREGRWILTGQPVQFDQEGQMIDGQHRMEAVIEADVPVVMLVVRGLPSEAFEAIDKGYRRTAAHDLQALGYTRTNDLASLATWAVRAEQGRLWWRYGDDKRFVSTAEVVDWVQRHPDVIDYLGSSLAWYGSTQIVRRSNIHFLLYTASTQINEALAEEFHAMLSKGVTDDESHPVYRLRERLIKQSISGERWDRYTELKALIKAWNKMYEGERIRQFRTPTASEQPQILGLANPVWLPDA